MFFQSNFRPLSAELVFFFFSYAFEKINQMVNIKKKKSIWMVLYPALLILMHWLLSGLHFYSFSHQCSSCTFLFTPHFPHFHTTFSAPLAPAGGTRFIRCVQICRAGSSPATKRTLERLSIAPTLRPFTSSVSTMPNRWVVTVVTCTFVYIHLTRMRIRDTVEAEC